MHLFFESSFLFKVTSDPPWWIAYFEFFVEGILLITVASFGIVGRFSPKKKNIFLCVFSLKSIPLTLRTLNLTSISSLCSFAVFSTQVSVMHNKKNRHKCLPIKCFGSEIIEGIGSLNYNCFRLSTKRSTTFFYCFLCLIW